MRENSSGRTNRTMVAHKADTIKAVIQPLHHIKGLMFTRNQCCSPFKVLWMKVAHIMMRIVDHKFARPTLQCSCDNCVNLVGEQSSSLLVFSIALYNLFPRHNTTGSFKIGRQKKFHRLIYLIHVWPGPAAARQISILACKPVRSGYCCSTACRNASTASSDTRLMVQPPKPPPSIRAPSTPGTLCAMSTRVSNSRQLTS